MKQASLLRSLGIIAFCLAMSPCQAQFFQQTNLVSDIPGLALNLDPDLRNPWGIATSSSSPFWVSNEVTGNSTLYNTAGTKQGLVVTIPDGHPTGTVFNPTGDFLLSNGTKGFFLFASLNGAIAGWNPAAGTNALKMVDNSGIGAVYTGLALGNNGSGNFLYAANASNNRIDIFDANFATAILPGNFTDPNVPAGFSVYNIQNLGGTLYVTYENETSGGGIVDAFDTNGNLLRRVSFNPDGGPLDSPWGVAIAPASFGPFANALLVGNEDNGRINAFDPLTGTFLGNLQGKNGQPISNTGLWGLIVGNGGNGGLPDTLYFAAGIRDEEHGLFGSLTFVNQPQVVPEPGAAPMLLGLAVGMSLLLHRRRRA